MLVKSRLNASAVTQTVELLEMPFQQPAQKLLISFSVQPTAWPPPAQCPVELRRLGETGDLMYVYVACITAHSVTVCLLHAELQSPRAAAQPRITCNV